MNKKMKIYKISGAVRGMIHMYSHELRRQTGKILNPVFGSFKIYKTMRMRLINDL